MGAFCSCFHVEDFEDEENRSTDRHCMCFSSYLFYEVATSTTAATLDNTLVDANGSLPSRSLPYNTNYPDLQCEEHDSTHQKGTSHSHEYSDAHRINSVHIGPQIFSGVEMQNASYCGKKIKACNSESSVKLLLAKVGIEVGDLYSSSEDEDVCPICLEGYTHENPEIVLQCSHHYHLGCAYEWMERSPCCPICDKVMIFEETPQNASDLSSEDVLQA
ncbi:E3 ubiquitin-protein ligase At3g02290 [Malania oleifera]|uniref:E3 ubiquitin-protein ligase At3g02290 n=1 Tax=Malania oleifera TaxID=397392 RepID=UPI0025AEA41F|nr:E3 ubiquitin-protein ligase At3g02290 [Malania oleifera]